MGSQARVPAPQENNEQIMIESFSNAYMVASSSDVSLVKLYILQNE